MESFYPFVYLLRSESWEKIPTAPYITLWLALVLWALLAAYVARGRRIELVAAGFAHAAVVGALLGVVVDIVGTYDFILGAHRLTAPPWPDVPADVQSSMIAKRIHGELWILLVWATALLYPTTRALLRALRGREHVRRCRLGLLWLPLFAAALLIVHWAFSWVLWQPFRCGLVTITDRHWDEANLAFADLELRRTILQGVIVSALALLAVRGRLWRPAPLSRGSLIVGVLALALGAAAHLAVAPLRADVVDYVRHDETPGHVHQPIWSVEEDVARRGYSALVRCEPVVPRDSCRLEPRSAAVLEREGWLGRAPDYTECDAGVYLTATREAPIAEVRDAFAFAAAQGVSQVHVLSLRVAARPLQTTTRLARTSFCGHALALESTISRLPTQGTWGVFVDQLNARDVDARAR